MSGFSEDDRIRHKNDKFGNAFTNKKNNISLTLVDISIIEIVELFKEKGLTVELTHEGVMIVTSNV